VLAACAETVQRMRMRPVKKDMSVLLQCAEQSHALALSFNILYDSISTELFIRGLFLSLNWNETENDRFWPKISCYYLLNVLKCSVFAHLTIICILTNFLLTKKQSWV
jgi:hypothetical protein